MKVTTLTHCQAECYLIQEHREGSASPYSKRAPRRAPFLEGRMEVGAKVGTKVSTKIQHQGQRQGQRLSSPQLQGGERV